MQKSSKILRTFRGLVKQDPSAFTGKGQQRLGKKKSSRTKNCSSLFVGHNSGLSKINK